MFDPHAQWPFYLTRKSWPHLAGIAVFLLILIATSDAATTIQVSALPDAVRAPFFVITRLGNSDWILIPTLLGTISGAALGTLWPMGPMRRRLFTFASIAFFIFSAVAVPGIVANLIKRLVGRARPVSFEEYGPLHFEPFRDWSFQSFPSGDTTTIFALAAALMFFLPRYKWWLLVGALLVGVSRVMVGMHFPSDVFGGFLLGSLGAYAVRNACAQRGWLFRQEAGGDVRPAPDWPPADHT